jgi:hypothetical protein
LSAPAPAQWLLRSRGPVRLRCVRADGSIETHRSMRCRCGRDTDWLIIADERNVVFVCRCGKRSVHQGLPLTDVVGLVEDAPTRTGWSGVDDAVRALGFAPAARRPHVRVTLPHLRIWPRQRCQGSKRSSV